MHQTRDHEHQLIIETLPAAPHDTRQVQLDRHLPEGRGKIVALILNFRKLGSEYISGMLHANIDCQCSRFSFRFVHFLIWGYARPNFEFVEEPIIYWHKRVEKR